MPRNKTVVIKNIGSEYVLAQGEYREVVSISSNKVIAHLVKEGLRVFFNRSNTALPFPERINVIRRELEDIIKYD
jgi:hypothetical protein